MSKKLTKEDLVNKGVGYKTEGKETIFSLSSFRKKYPKLDVSESNIIEVEKDGKTLNYFKVEHIQEKNTKPKKEEENGTA